MGSLIELVNTIFTGGVFMLLLGITWKGATFVQWVRDGFDRNDAAHVRIEEAIGDVDGRVNGVEERLGELSK